MTIIATWNVNSVRARLPRVLEWLDEFKPDVALLQELKATDETFPRLEIEDRGYNIEIHGQKNFNGVGILSKTPIEDVTRGLPCNEDDDQARYIEGFTAGLRHYQAAVRVHGKPGNGIELAVWAINVVVLVSSRSPRFRS